MGESERLIANIDSLLAYAKIVTQKNVRDEWTRAKLIEILERCEKHSAELKLDGGRDE